MEIIICTNTEWDSPPRARHQLAFALAKKNIKTTFISGNIYGKPDFEYRYPQENLEVIIPIFPISRRVRYRTPIINESYQIWLYSFLKKKFKDKDVCVICTDFGGYLISNFFTKIVFFASDDYINNTKIVFFMKYYTVYTQKALIKNSIFTLATAASLVSGFKKINPHSYELPLGSPEFNFPEKNGYREKDGKIKVVLLGFIDKVKTPVDLIKKILEIENTELYLIGPIKDDFLKSFQESQNLFSLGSQTGEKLLNSLLKMDVGIAPYYMKDSNTGRTPNKMWQYLASGKPAVITNLPNVQHWEFPEGTVYKANTDEDFIKMISIAYENDSLELVEERIKLAKKNSWGKRADQFLDYFETHLL